jgi:oligopeptide transport system permease protein
MATTAPTTPDVLPAAPPIVRGFWSTLGLSGTIGAAVLLAIVAPCVLTLPWSLKYYDVVNLTGNAPLAAPSSAQLLGTDLLGRSLVWRCMLGGAISLGIGGAAAAISVVIGVLWGATAGYVGGRVDSAMMRIVDVLYGLPYILLVVLVNIAIKPHIQKAAGVFCSEQNSKIVGDIATLLIAIGGVSWLTMARVIRGQVLSLRAQPFMEAARALGLGPWRTFANHLLPNLVGPIIVYATLTVPSAILQESFLSFLGIGVQPPLPSWGNLAADGLNELQKLGHSYGTIYWWLMLWPCVLLGMTLLALNFLGDALRTRLDPRRLR